VVFEQTISVETVSLDAWCQENNVYQIDFIWMDVQGAEIDVFNGAIQTLKNTRFLYTEYSNTELYEGQKNLSEISENLAASNFQLIRRYHGDVLYKNTSLSKS
jgi:hypothetical protein